MRLLRKRSRPISTDATHEFRVLVISADIGEGHLSAARALSERLRELDDVKVIERDGLVAFGRLLRHLMRDGYRWQLRWAPWSYTALYVLMTRSAVARRVGGRVLALAGQRALLRMVLADRPDVVVTTHPAVTSVLGRLRLRRRLAVPVCATITDLADYAFWSHKGADLHLVMHEQSIAPVEKAAGVGSARLVGPLVAKGFLAPRDPREARAALGLPCEGRIVVISGGGWGVGDLEGAARCALRRDDTFVVVLSGRNEQAREHLDAAFVGESRVRVTGFTDRMNDLLHAADVLVHSTGGVTSLEALSCGCPLIAYGITAGHIRAHNRTLVALGFIEIADSPAELSDALQDVLDRDRSAASRLIHGVCPAETVLGVSQRVKPLARWRLLLEPSVGALAALLLLVGGVATDDAYSVVSRLSEARPVTHFNTADDRVGLVIRAPDKLAVGLSREVRLRGVSASFAEVGQPSASSRTTTERLRSQMLPELAPGGRLRWLHTAEALEGAHRVGRDRLYLVPRTGLTLAQYLLGRMVDASPITGKVWLDASHPVPGPEVRLGDVVVTTVTSSSPAARLQIRQLIDELSSRGLRASSLPALMLRAPA